MFVARFSPDIQGDLERGWSAPQGTWSKSASDAAEFLTNLQHDDEDRAAFVSRMIDEGLIRTLRPGQVISPPLAGPAAQYRYILAAARVRGCTKPLPLEEQASQQRALQYLQTLCPPGYHVRQRSWDGSWVVDPIPSEEK